MIAESCYLLRKLPGASEAVLSNVDNGAFQIPLQLSGAASSVQRILRKYRDREIGLADACLIHLAAELRTGAILILDHDFRIYRWAGNRAFDFLLEISG